MLSRIVTLLLISFALGVGVRPDLVSRVVGRVPAGELDPADLGADEPRAEVGSGRDARDRRVVRLRVPRDLTVRELLALVELDLPHVRKALAEQEGREDLADDHLLRAGSVFRVPLEPESEPEAP